MSLREFKLIDQAGEFEILEETLSDLSKAYSVRYFDKYGELTIDCTDEDSAFAIAEALNKGMSDIEYNPNATLAAHALGAIGGRSVTQIKGRAAKRNGKKGGRPKKAKNP